MSSIATAQTYYEKTTIPPTTSLSRIFDVSNYGAKCDGATDDSAAWNLAITAAKNANNVSGTPITAVLLGCTGQSMIKSTLNFSGINSPAPTAFTVDMSGTCLLGETNGTPVIDAFGSKYMRWVHPCIKGMNVLTPNVGIQFGRIVGGNPADQFYWDHPVVEGFYTFAAIYNDASEDNTWLSPRIANATVSASTTFGIVEDGYNFWVNAGKITSSFQTLFSGVTAFSFIGDTFLGGNIVDNNTTATTPASAPIWTGQTSQHHYFGTYVNSNTPYDVILYCGTATSGGVNKNLTFDIHAESSPFITSTFLLTGAQVGACTLYDFTFNENLEFASSSVFAIDGTSAVTSAVFDNAVLRIDTFQNAISVFDTPANYAWSGTAWVQSSSNWNTPGNFSGTLCFATRCDSYTNPTGTQNVAQGPSALSSASLSGNFNTAFGLSVLSGAGTAGNNTGMGYNVMTGVTSGSTNAAFGSTAGQFISTGTGNSAFGFGAMSGLTGARLTANPGNNTAAGSNALNNIQGVAASNTALGAGACGATLTTGTGNICIGVDSTTDTAAAATSNTLQIRGKSPGIAVIAASGLNTAAPLLSMPADMRTGTKFTVTGTGACGTTSTTLGGASAGSFLCTGVAGASTATITIAGATGNTATNGWACTASDATSGAAWAMSGAASTTTATIGGTIAVTSDRVVFSCTGY